jgi:hypothetical protein
VIVRTEDPADWMEALVAERAPRLALDRELAGCGECAYPHVHSYHGRKVGTICQIDGLCWTEERRRIALERESARAERRGYTRGMTTHEGRTGGEDGDQDQ